jgi:hypothetical protein
VQDHLAQHRRDRQRHALHGQIDGAGFDEQVAQARVGSGAIAVRHPARNPDATLGWHDPQRIGHFAGHRPMQRQNQLALAVLMHGNLRVVLGYLQAAGDRRAIGLIRVQVKAGERNASHSHIDRF